jgi:hypothetical protein
VTPVWLRGVLDALRFGDPDHTGLLGLNEEEWSRALRFCDKAQLTLALRGPLPHRIRERIARDRLNNAERWRRTRTAYEEIAERFQAAGIPYAVLKGFSHCPEYTERPEDRIQRDIDLLCRREDLAEARRQTAMLGYEPLEDTKGNLVDHLPTMIRRTGWRWRGDYFDPSIPPAVELHFRLWDERTERVEAPDLDI